jgi:hypothetical protein
MAPEVKDARPGADTYIVRDDARRFEAGSALPPAISARSSLSVMRCGSTSAIEARVKALWALRWRELATRAGMSVHEFE